MNMILSAYMIGALINLVLSVMLIKIFFKGDQDFVQKILLSIMIIGSISIVLLAFYFLLTKCTCEL